MYSYYTNWGLEEVEKKRRDDKYKAIGETINTIETEGDEDEDDGLIYANDDKWIEAVGEGSWHATEGEDYYFLWVKTNTKTIAFGTVYYDCHYPDTIWEFVY